MPRYQIQIDPDPDPSWAIALLIILLALLYPIARFLVVLAILAALVWGVYRLIDCLTKKDDDYES